MYNPIYIDLFAYLHVKETYTTQSSNLVPTNIFSMSTMYTNCCY